MAVDDLHKQYIDFYPQWARIRACLAGRDAILKSGVTYLPKLGGQDEIEYDAYAKRGAWFNATGRTHEAYKGLVFSRPPTISTGDNARLDAIFDDVDLDGSSLAQFAADVVDEVLATRRCMVLVDHNETGADDGGTSINEQSRPYLRKYPAESILNWKERTVRGRREVSRVILQEQLEIDTVNEFETADIEQLRVLDIVDQDGASAYRVRLFRSAEVKDERSRVITKIWQQFGEDEIPLISGVPWQFIPAIFIGSNSAGECRKPPLLDLADLNLAHWRTSADFEHGAHFTGLPTPYICGVDTDEQQSFAIGSSKFLVFEAPETKLGYLEFTGQGLSVLQSSLDKKERQMAAIGARMLGPEKNQAESGEALSIRRGGDLASLADVSGTVSRQLTLAMQWLAQWSTLRASDAANVQAVSISLNSQFVDERLSAQDVSALLAAYLADGISHETFLYNMQRGGRIEETRSIEDELEAIRDGSLSGNAPPPEPPEA